MLYELREYTAAPGKLPALVQRFNDHTLDLFRKHGIDIVFMSHTELGDNSTNELVYAVRFSSYEQVETTWAGFLADPEWQRVKRDSERDGPLVTQVRRRLLTTRPFDSSS